MNPKQFPKKMGKLRNARAAPLRQGKVTFRAVFVLDENAREVILVAFAPHDEAYAQAARRL